MIDHKTPGDVLAALAARRLEAQLEGHLLTDVRQFTALFSRAEIFQAPDPEAAFHRPIDALATEIRAKGYVLCGRRHDLPHGLMTAERVCSEDTSLAVRLLQDYSIKDDALLMRVDVYAGRLTPKAPA